MVKFRGDLVGRGLVPAEGVMTWIHTLLSEKARPEISEIPDAGHFYRELGGQLLSFFGSNPSKLNAKR